MNQIVSGEAEAEVEEREDSELLLSDWQQKWREVDGVEMFGGYNDPLLVID